VGDLIRPSGVAAYGLNYFDVGYLRARKQNEFEGREAREILNIDKLSL
jgi:hypothetical protein